MICFLTYGVIHKVKSSYTNGVRREGEMAKCERKAGVIPSFNAIQCKTQLKKSEIINK